MTFCYSHWNRLSRWPGRPPESGRARIWTWASWHPIPAWHQFASHPPSLSSFLFVCWVCFFLCLLYKFQRRLWTLWRISAAVGVGGDCSSMSFCLLNCISTVSSMLTAKAQFSLADLQPDPLSSPDVITSGLCYIYFSFFCEFIYPHA